LGMADRDAISFNRISGATRSHGSCSSLAFSSRLEGEHDLAETIFVMGAGERDRMVLRSGDRGLHGLTTAS
jgi:hypothetical protein